VCADRVPALAVLAVVAAMLGIGGAARAQCIASPMQPDDGYAVSPFGVDRSNSPGASAGWHLGIDLQKTENSSGGGNKTSPLYAPFDGTVTAAPNAGGAGNMLVFRRADGAQVEYLHMDRFAPNLESAKGVPITAGQYVGELGGTPHYAKHLHVQMKIPAMSALDYRDRMYAAVPGAKSKSNTPFTADKLTSGSAPSSGMVFVDPQYWLNRQYTWTGDVAKYTAQGFQMAPGNKTLTPTCSAGGDPTTTAQQNANDAMGGDPSGLTAAQLDAKGFKDGDRVGVVDAPPFMTYADLSEKDIVVTEAGRRMTDAGWDHQVAAAGTRGLTIEIARIRAASLFIDQRIEEKKQRVEAMVAALLVLRTKRMLTFQVVSSK